MKSWRISTKMFTRRKSTRTTADAEKFETFPRSSKKIALGGNKKIGTEVEAKSVEIWATPVKSESDKKEYQVIKLSNGLIATLISDSPNLVDLNSENDSSGKGRPGRRKHVKLAELTKESPSKDAKEKLAACALTIEVGSFSDPDNIQGLAHFLEHMIFMGSKKYPKENKLDAFLSKHGGFQNASTDSECTTFYLACPEKQLFQAMDIFSQFFVSPLLKWNAINRERESIESEFQQAFTSDHARAEQLLCSLASGDNPARKFSWGNQYTLRDKVKNKELHEALKEFQKTHYSSDRMKLAVQGRLPLETLKEWVTTCFSTIPKSPNKPLVFEPKELFDMEKFCRFYFVQPVKDVMKLSLHWVLPPVLRKYKSKPLDYLAFVIGHEGPGSLLSFLKKNLWAVGLGAGYEDGLLSNELFTVFSISVSLTDEGKEAVEEILTSVFSYLNLLKENGPDRRLFEEIQSINELEFRFQEEPEAEDHVESVSTAMVLYPPEDFLRGSELLFEYKPEEISNYLARMSPSACNIMLRAKNLQVALDQEEFWFKTKYSSAPVSKDSVRKWQNIKAYSDFHLPEKNQFITSDFKIIKHANIPKYPKKITLSDSAELWHKGDDKFLLPIASISILMMMGPKNALSPENWVMSVLFVTLLEYQLKEELYNAEIANLDYDVSLSKRGVRIMVYGYNQHLGCLVERLAQGFGCFEQKVDEKVFKVFQKRLLRFYYNSTLDASALAGDVFLKASVTSWFSYAENYAAIKSVSMKSFMEHAKYLLDGVRFQALIQGNLSEHDAVNIVTRVMSIIEPKAVQVLPATRGPLNFEFPYGRVKILPKGEKCFKLQSFNVEDKNCVTQVYYQLGPGTIRDAVLLELFVAIMQEPLFDKLRTKLQLGYEVSASADATKGILGLSITVLSQISKVPMPQVKDKIDEFLNGFVKNFPKMGSDDFSNFRQSLIDSKNSVDLSLSDEVGRNLREITKQEFVFDRLQKEIEAVSTLDLKAVSSSMSSFLTPGNEKYRKLVVQVVGHDGPKAAAQESKYEDASSSANDRHTLPDDIIYSLLTTPNSPPGYFVTDFDEWKTSLPEYPPHKIIE